MGQELVPDTHPYLQYMINVQRNAKIEVPLPASAPYVARHLQGAIINSGQLKTTVAPQMSLDKDETGSVDSTVASPTEILRLPNEEDVFFDCREEDDDEGSLPASLARSPSA